MSLVKHKNANMSETFTIKDVHARHAGLTRGGAFNVNTPFQTRYDDFSTLRPHNPHVSNIQAHNIMTNNEDIMPTGGQFSLDTYQENANAGLVYSGKMKDPVTGEEFYTFENELPEKEVDESLNPSTTAMDRLTELAMGSTDDDIKHRLDISNHKPEENNMLHALKPEDGLRTQFGDWDSVRLWDLQRAQEESHRTIDNNFEGIDERVGGPSGYRGYQPMHYARPQDVKAQVTAYELDDRERMANPAAQVGQHGAWAKPTQYNRKELHDEWKQGGKWGQTFGFRDVNEYPGDAEARRQPPTFVHNTPEVQVILM